VDKILLSALQGNKTSRAPFWFMRQAGRFLPEYRETRKQAGSFLDLCYNPELASEVTLQPIRRFGMDGAILFSDILVVPYALGVDVRFAEGEGPIVEKILTRDRISKLDLTNVRKYTAPIMETVKRAKVQLPAHVTMLGFAGSPWTVATYLVEGKGSKDYAGVRGFAYENQKLFQSLIDILCDATVDYLSAQIEAGAEAVQLFDSWAGVLSPDQFREWVIKPNARIASALKDCHPEIPIIGFPRGAGAMLAEYVHAVPCDAVSVDYTQPVASAKSAIAGKCLQGNLDPVLVASDKKAMLDSARAILETMRGHPFIFNFGHGMLPHTPIENVEALCDLIRGFSLR
jgi:uroporphyrinogen decarboxylase